MTLRITTNVLGLVLLLFSGWASALGLGELKMNSAMNEPMDAEIVILNLGDLTENEVQVKLAGAADFERAGVERLFSLTDLKFTLDLSKSSRPLIRVTSQKPIKEPYLDFLVDMRWTSGRMLREYTVLMDLPAFAMEKPAGKQVTATRSSSSAVTAVPVPPSRGTSVASSSPSTPVAAAPAPKAQAPAPAPVVAEPSTYTSADSYTVSAGDTLWAIASRHRPAGATVQQTIMAIYQSNPEAFINNNSNLVRKGAVLRLPEASEIQNLSHQQAANELKEHTNTWQSETASSLSSSEPEATVEAVAESSDSAGSSTSNTDSGRLRLSAAGDEGEGAGIGGEGGAGSGNGRELIENDLAIAQEELERSSRENAELKQKLQMLEEQVSAMSRLVELEDSGLRGAQLATANSDDPVRDGSVGDESEEEAGSFSFSDIVADEQTAENAAGSLDETGATEEVGAILQEVEASADSIVSGETTHSEATLPEDISAPVEPLAPPVIKAEPGLVAGLIESVKSLLLPIGAGLLVLVGLIVMLMRRRGSADADKVDLKMIEPDDVLSGSKAESTTTEPLVAVGAESSAIEDEIELDDEDLLFTQAIQNLNTDVGDLDLDESDQVDAVGEAEIYLSLGNHDTAAEILVKAVERNPDDTAAQLKLLEIYGEKKDETAFDQQAAKLGAVADPAVIAEVGRMRAEVFGAAATIAPQADYIELPEDDDFSFDLDLGDTATTELEDSLELPDSGETDLVELDMPELDMAELDMDSLETGTLESLVSATEATDSAGDDGGDFDLDLDLDFDLDLGEVAETADSAGAGLVESTVDNSLDADVEEAVVDESMDLDLGEGFDLLDGSDEIGTQLELAQAYVDMGDSEGAREILEHVSLSGNEVQQASAKNLLAKLG
ncbi:MAG: LysM peptidoglycan-binding domain-containing protein [Porticoccaceae bacterium]|nr:LysM peptidoglycan-binding domain-containing protein [Porticoccaceae bacterium]